MKRLFVVLVLMLLWATPARAAYALVSHATCSGGSGGVSAGCSLSGSGADLIVIVDAHCHPAVCGNAGTATPSDSSGNAYTQCGSTVLGSNGPDLKIWYSQAPTVTGSMTFTESETNSYTALAVSTWSGSAATPCDQNTGSSNTGTGTTWQGGSITPSTSNQLVITGYGNGGSAGSSVSGSSVTQLDIKEWSSGANMGSGDGYVIQTVAAAFNPTWTFGSVSAGNVDVENVSFKSGAGVTKKLFLPNPLTGLGAGGAFFADPLQMIWIPLAGVLGVCVLALALFATVKAIELTSEITAPFRDLIQYKRIEKARDQRLAQMMQDEQWQATKRDRVKVPTKHG